jgi:hypothetical protein
MLELVQIIKHSDERFQSEIRKAKSSKNSDRSRIERRINEAYFTRLGRATLGVSQNIPLTDKSLSLAVSFPEVLFSKMLALGWNPTREQKEHKEGQPELLTKYFNAFNDKYKLIDFNKLNERINNETFKSLLLCHGLSPTSDTILLLADIGRSLRMSNSIGITDIQILLADVTWIKYNRSINQLFSQKEFMNHLRICLDKRKRIYRALNLDYKTFGISDHNPDQNNLSKTEITKHSKNFRALAELFWGKKSLEPHKEDMLKIIGKPLSQISKKDLTNIPPTINKFIELKDGEVAKAIEEKLQSEFKILRTISELFSSFDEEVFLYYFAQYFAQTHFNNFLKIAPLSEEKFDQPFLKYAEDFDKITHKEDTSIGKPESGYIYCPQYVLGSFQILPYTSVSGDVVKRVSVEEFKSKTILLDDSYDNKIDKIIGVITTTEIQHRNRLLSDLLSFIHFLFQNIDIELKKPILKELEIISVDIYTQICSTTDGPVDYLNIFSDWMKSISNHDSFIPFHIIPYLWEEQDWTQEKIIKVSNLIMRLLEVVNEICE